MTHEKTVIVSLKDLCEIADAVSTMMHDLDNGKNKHLESEIEKIHLVVERWAVDETVLAGGCHPDHRCRLCHAFPGLAERRVRRNQEAEKVSLARRDTRGEEPPDKSEMPEPLQFGRKLTYSYEDEEFILEHISETVVQVTHPYDIGYFGLVADWDSTRPYTWTRDDWEVHPGGIARVRFHTHSTPKAALDTLCYAILDDVWREPARRVLREFTEYLAE